MADEDKRYPQFVKLDTDDNGFYGVVYSEDNGIHKTLLVGSKGLILRQKDADHIWPFLIDKVKAVMSGSLNVDWSDIQNKPDLSQYVTKDELPAQSDLSGYAKTSDIPKSMTWSQITGKPNVATKDDVDYLKTLIGSSSGSGDAGLTIEAIVELIKHHLKAKMDVNSGNLLIDVDDVTNGSIADAVATKVAQSIQFKLQGSDLVAEIGGTE